MDDIISFFVLFLYLLFINCSPDHSNQEYDIDVADMPRLVKEITANYIHGFKLAVDTCFVNDLVPYEVIRRLADPTSIT